MVPSYEITPTPATGQKMRAPACDDDGNTKVNVVVGELMLDPTNLATSAKQDTQTTALGLLAKETGGNLATLVTSLAALVTANHVDLAAILAKIIAAPATEAKQDDGNASLAEIDTAVLDIDNTTASLLAALKPPTTFIPIDYGAGNQVISDVNGSPMRGFNITTAGILKLDCAGVTNQPYYVTLGINWLAGVTKIYQSGSAAAGSVVG